MERILIETRRAGKSFVNIGIAGCRLDGRKAFGKPGGEPVGGASTATAC
jgi:hypothetical protein